MKMIRRDVSIPFLLIGCLGCLCSLPVGCNRAHYRKQADEEVYHTISTHAPLIQVPLQEYSIQPFPASRNLDVYKQDFPPMPQDDPLSNRYMHYVDHKKGYDWGKFGNRQFRENPAWPSLLPRNNDGEVVLSEDSSVKLARVNSRDYQLELEDLYLSALDVTFERFQFDVMYFGTHDTTFDVQGREFAGQTQSLLRLDDDFQVSKRFATGGQFVAGLANSIVWQFSGDDMYFASSLLDFTLIQPLLREGSRAVALERLTFAERALLANVRQMERFRRAFTVEVLTGVNAGAGPVRSGNFGQIGSVTNLPNLGSTGAGQAGGFYGLLQQLQTIRNQEANLAAVRDSLIQLEAAYDAGRIDLFQVDQTRQALYRAQSQLLTSQTRYQDAQDDFLIFLGLPPCLDVNLDESLIEPLNLLDPQFTELRDELALVIGESRELDPESDRTVIMEKFNTVADYQDQILDQMATVRTDLQQLLRNAPQRRRNLESLTKNNTFAGSFELTEFSPDTFDQRVETLQQAYQELELKVAQSYYDLLSLEEVAETLEPNEFRLRMVNAMVFLASDLLDLALLQAEIRVDAVVLPSVNLTDEQAFEIASVNRRDWMNARAAVVDSWRLIEVAGNALEADLDIVVDGQLGTLGDNVLGFRGENGRLRMSLQFDAPLTRLGERNNYRESQIAYQRTRRAYMEFVDSISGNLRSVIRRLDRNRYDFELRRSAIRVAISQVVLASLRLNQPPKPVAGQSGGQQQFGATTARDLLSALSDLLDAQNDFLGVWIDYQVQRMVLDRDMGTMQLDPYGQWIDPGTIDLENLNGIPGKPGKKTPSKSSGPAMDDFEEIPAPPGKEVPKEADLEWLRPLEGPRLLDKNLPEPPLPGAPAIQLVSQVTEDQQAENEPTSEKSDKQEGKQKNKQNRKLPEPAVRPAPLR
ncbi:Hypothetical protein PBC10988_19580 [Planctomycetales bacterium 10988]|nr:Hypothetical protein PBC10988_19580 [Planctomycetales bacterium 10988]